MTGPYVYKMTQLLHQALGQIAICENLLEVYDATFCEREVKLLRTDFQGPLFYWMPFTSPNNY